jgi:hypothetical protein
MSTIILARTASRRYAIRHADTIEIRLMAGPHDQTDATGRPFVVRELGPLLDAADCGVLHRPRALVVPLRRRSVALLVARIEEFLEEPVVRALPTVLRDQLRQPWSTGAILIDDEAVVLLDLRAVARTVLMAAHPQASA